MPDLSALHVAAREIFDEALKSVDAKRAVRRAVHLNGSRLKLVNTTFNLADNYTGIYAIAIGKAALQMAAALSDTLKERLTAGIITAPAAEQSQTNAVAAKHTTPINVSFSDCWRVFEGGHPLPNRESLAAAQAAFGLLHRANHERAIVIFLISGGGSALMEWPRDERTTLEDLRKTNEALVSCGANIAEINAVRRAISEVKGGGLARLAPHCAQVSLIVSDTNASEKAIVASGPTFDPPFDAPLAAHVIARYKLERALPESILHVIKHPLKKTVQTQEQHHSLREHYVLLDNEHALVSAAEAARSRGFTVEVARDVIEQPIAEGCSLLLSRLFDLSRRTSTRRAGVCLISGGEFKCPVPGSGTGGRNLESVLRWAIELETINKDQSGISHVVALSAGTDGIDGNSPAAGAICDETTIQRARELSLDAQRYLEESNAYTFFQSLNDAVVTGATETNVRDLRIMLKS